MPEARPIRVVLADDSFLMREAVHQVVAHQDNVEIVADCGDGASLLEEVERLRPDVVITDVRMPPSGDDEGIRVAQRLRETDPGIGVVVLSHYADPRYGRELFAGGAEGRAYLLKDRVNDGRELRAAIEVVVARRLDDRSRDRPPPARERGAPARLAAQGSDAARARGARRDGVRQEQRRDRRRSSC